MSTYRVTVMVTTDVEGIDRADAAGNAIYRIKQAVGDKGQTGRKMWVTGIGRTHDNEDYFMIYEQAGV